MQHNNWNAFLQVFSARSQVMTTAQLMLFRGDAPDMSPGQTKEAMVSMLSERASDWIATYDLSSEVQIYNRQHDTPFMTRNDADEEHVSWGNCPSTVFKPFGFDDSANYLRRGYRCTTLLLSNDQLADDTAQTPTWMALVPRGAVMDEGGYNKPTVYFIGQVSRPDALNKDALLSLRSLPLAGQAPQPGDIGYFALPL